jgi:hypothetical protein
MWVQNSSQKWRIGCLTITETEQNNANNGYASLLYEGESNENSTIF